MQASYKMKTHTIIALDTVVPTVHNNISSLRRTSLTAGLLYLLTFICIPTLTLYRAVHEKNYVLGTGPDTPVLIGGLLEITVALAGIATAIVLYPVLKRQSERLALGLVAARVLEASTMFLGVAFLLSAVTLRQENAGADAMITSHALVTLYDRIFLLGQGFIPAIDDLLIGILLYKSRLIPKGLALIGIIGAFPLIAGFLAVLFGKTEFQSVYSMLSAIMVAVFEFSLGIYLVVRGFKDSPVTSGM